MFDKLTYNGGGVVVGFAGFAGSGKDTAADYLVNNYGFTKISFADAVKDVLAIVFCWDRDMLEGKTSQSRKWREEVDEAWAEALNIPDFTPRKAMQMVGTDLFRKFISDEIWVLNVVQKILKVFAEGGDVVIADCRFPNEIDMVKCFQGDVIEVSRGDQPEWYNTAVYANRGSETDLNKMNATGVHQSEWKWCGKATKRVTNDSTLGYLYELVEGCMADELKKFR